jgi:uncharacterized protein (TIGR04255 family)
MMCEVECVIEERLMNKSLERAVLREIHLTDSLLVKVLIQLRFPIIAKIDNLEGVLAFQEHLRAHYPVMRPEQVMTIGVTPGTIPNSSTATLWRLSDADQIWTVVLSRDFVALETSMYDTRDDFLERWGEVLNGLNLLDPGPSVFDRLGIRYINRLSGNDIGSKLPELIRKELVGAISVDTPNGTELLTNVSQSHYKINAMQMTANWGILPAGMVFLPGIEPANERSWVLDVDVFKNGPDKFSVDTVAGLSREAAENAYGFFRWAVTEKYLVERGGQL